jgi:hypothetical protein
MNEPILYLAGAWAERERLRLMRSLLCAAGFRVRSSWLDQRGPSDEPEPANFERASAMGEWASFYRDCAERDLSDVLGSDAFVLFEGEVASRGACTEFGFALAKGRPVFVVGGPSQVFHLAHGVTQVEGLTGLVIALSAQFAPTLLERSIMSVEEFGRLSTAHHPDCSFWYIGQPCDCVSAVRPFAKEPK